MHAAVSVAMLLIHVLGVNNLTHYLINLLNQIHDLMTLLQMDHLNPVEDH